MLSRNSKYTEAAADSDEDDDFVDGIAVPEQRRQSRLQLSSSVSSSGTRNKTLDHYFHRQQHPQHPLPVGEQTPLPQPQQHQPRADGTAPVNRRKRRAREPSIDLGDELVIFSSDEEDAAARQSSRKPAIASASKGSTTAPSARPFSKSDFLKKFESDASDGEVEEEEEEGDFDEESGDRSDDDELMMEDGLTSPDSQDITPGKSLSSINDFQVSEVDDEEDELEEINDRDSDDTLSDEVDLVHEFSTPKKHPQGDLALVESTPRRSMTTSQPVGSSSLEKLRLQLDKQEREARERVVKEASERDITINSTRNFDIVVTNPTYEQVADYLINPDEWEAVAIDSRWTSEDGRARYKVVYKDGHSHTVSADQIHQHVSPQILEDFEHRLFAKEENPETYYYPNFKAPGGCFAGGTAITSGLHKKRGRRSDAKIYLDNCFRLGMPEEFNIPMTDSSESETDEEIENESSQPIVSSQLSGSQYDKFEITDTDILASIRENSSDNESWSGSRRKPTRGRPRGRGATAGRGSNITRGGNSVRGTTARGRGSTATRGPGRPPSIPSRGSSAPARGGPPLIPTRGSSAPQRGRPRLIPTRGSSNPVSRDSNVVKASVTSRGRGRPRGSKLLSTRDTSSQGSASPQITITAPERQPGVRGRPKGSKNQPKPVSIPSSRSDTSLSDMVIASPSPQQTPRQSHPQPPSPAPPPSNKKRTLKPTRAPKPPRTPTGARGPGRPPKSPKSPKKEDDLIEETIRTAGANITSSSNLLAPPPTRPDAGRPKKRRRIRIGSSGPEEHVVHLQATPPRASYPSTHHHHRPTHTNNHHNHHQHQPTNNIKPINNIKPTSSNKPTTGNKPTNKPQKPTFDVQEVVNKMFIDGSTFYEVRSRDPRTENVWIRLEDLHSKDARSKVKDFEKRLHAHEQRDVELKQLYNTFSAEVQLEKDKRRVAEREAQILGRGKANSTTGAVGPSVIVDIDAEQDKRDRERELQRQRERAARRLAMQETLFAGT
ncbi:hypothetical protein TWF696_007567 [Orbilia brochopaga]|uniref:Uncharacterized protein n=1 Tax=Orbilia brochopaga TaxID=3140254 RepID=A0AAV9UKJ6_9PEZI